MAGIQREREALLGYRRHLSPAEYQRWRNKVNNMSDTQIVAIFMRLKRDNKI